MSTRTDFVSVSDPKNVSGESSLVSFTKIVDPGFGSGVQSHIEQLGLHPPSLSPKTNMEGNRRKMTVSTTTKIPTVDSSESCDPSFSKDVRSLLSRRVSFTLKEEILGIIVEVFSRGGVF